MGLSLLEVKNLSVQFETSRGLVQAIDQVSLSVKPGEALGIVGESGSGKSVSSLAVMGLLPDNAKAQAEKMEFQGKELQKLSERQWRQIRGGQMAMIFQDPMTSLNPCFTVEFQIIEALKAHRGGSRKELKTKAIELLQQVGIPDPRSRLKSYPHQLSGGMSQRVMIAIAIACSPRLLIADEPTTALDVTIQAQILDLLKGIQQQNEMGLILISHDVAVVAEYCERIMVMYAGQSVEEGPTQKVIDSPAHPYTEGLLASLPEFHTDDEFRQPLPTIPGMVPDLLHRPQGCQLSPRCAYVEEKCRQKVVDMHRGEQRQVRCLKPLYPSQTTSSLQGVEQ